MDRSPNSWPEGLGHLAPALIALHRGIADTAGTPISPADASAGRERESNQPGYVVPCSLGRFAAGAYTVIGAGPSAMRPILTAAPILLMLN